MVLLLQMMDANGVGGDNCQKEKKTEIRFLNNKLLFQRILAVIAELDRELNYLSNGTKTEENGQELEEIQRIHEEGKSDHCGK
jgi:hypothetical protein